MSEPRPTEEPPPTPNVVYIEMAPMPLYRSITVAPNVVLDFDAEGFLVGVQVCGEAAELVANAMLGA